MKGLDMSFLNFLNNASEAVNRIVEMEQPFLQTLKMNHNRVETFCADIFTVLKTLKEKKAFANTYECARTQNLQRLILQDLMYTFRYHEVDGKYELLWKIVSCRNSMSNLIIELDSVVMQSQILIEVNETIATIVSRNYHSSEWSMATEFTDANSLMDHLMSIIKPAKEETEPQVHKALSKEELDLCFINRNFD